MYIEADTLDDLMYEVFKQLIKLPFNIVTTRGATNGDSSEIIGAMLHLTNPLARLSRTETKGTLFSALGETLWYLSGDNQLDFIKYYILRYKDESEDGKTIYGGYGPRLFNYKGTNQVKNIIDLLKRKPTSRRAVIQLFGAEDLSKSLEVPCTCTLQFFIRDNSLHLITYMRSNDCYWGLPHDIFAFTMLQEIIARTLEVNLGSYKHSVGSLHLYENMKGAVEQYLNEGLQSTKKFMPSMPLGNPTSIISLILEQEQKIRNGEDVNIIDLKIDTYWSDLLILLRIYFLIKKERLDEIPALKDKVTDIGYKTFIDNRVAFTVKKIKKRNEQGA